MHAQDRRVRRRARGVAVAPVREGAHRGRKICAGLGKPVLMSLPSSVVVGDLDEDPVVHQSAQAVGQDVVGDSEMLAELVEAADAEGRIPQDQQNPAVAEKCSGSADRARTRVVSHRRARPSGRAIRLGLHVESVTRISDYSF